MKKPFEKAVANLESEGKEVIFKKVSYVVENMKEVYDKCSRYNGKHSCIIHGDCWSNNMLFKYNESGELDDVKLVDFQLTRKTTPIHDLSYFFYSGASKEDFDKLDEYLEIYHESFSQFSQELGFRGDDLLPLNVLKDEWKTYSMLGVFMGIFLWELKLIPKDDAKNIGENHQSLDETQIREKWRVVLEKVFKDERFKTRTKDILLHAVEYGII
ncbi:uncharacterized protein LOC115888195 isoform X2 [Sitophilus oryzae]|uniref:Uncharacterized protein LOC115888195 isoform X2 n=1 Tax=Sitophilus oryzae TaxID=7048 RepID=A0A6J2YKL5_SITOR|nr:uncharacterized protein LOC115888195 isoform X2 [Sitophilus oryzae]